MSSGEAPGITIVTTPTGIETSGVDSLVIEKAAMVPPQRETRDHEDGELPLVEEKLPEREHTLT